MIGIYTIAEQVFINPGLWPTIPDGKPEL